MKTINGWKVETFGDHEIVIEKGGHFIRLIGDSEMTSEVLVERARTLAQLEDRRSEEIEFLINQVSETSDEQLRIARFAKLLADSRLTPAERQEVEDLMAFKPMNGGR